MIAANAIESGAAISNNPAPELPDPHSDYFANICPIPPVICGRQMKTLSIGRYRLLKRFKSAFVADGDATATAGDLLVSILICSMELDEFFKMVGSPDFGKQLDRWGRKFGFFPPRYFKFPLVGKLLYKLVGAAKDNADLVYLTGEIGKFQQYIQENSKSPHYWDKSENDRASGAHWSQSVEVVLRGQVGWTKDEIDSEPLNKAIWDFYKHMEQNGLVELMTAEEIADMNAAPTPEQIAAEKAWVEEKAKVT